MKDYLFFVFQFMGVVVFCGIVAFVIMHEPPPTWEIHYRPETPDEKRAVAEHETKLLSETPTTIAGDDQDWDDVMAKAHEISCELFCKPRLYEIRNRFIETGRWKEVSQ